MGNEAGNRFFLGGTVGNVEMELLAWAANEYIVCGSFICIALYEVHMRRLMTPSPSA